jgi:hypothetical protein
MSALTRTTGLRFPNRARKQAGISLAAFLLIVAVLPAAEETPFSTLAKFAMSLSENDADGALEIFDSQMKGYGQIEQDIESLTAQADISCDIEILTDTEASGVHKLDVDWFLQLKSQTDDALLDRRRERVQIEMRQIKGHWKIVSMAPLKILDPINIG